MEKDILETVLTEVLQEQKTANVGNQQIAELLKMLADKVNDFELKIAQIEVTAPAINTLPFETIVAKGLSKIQETVEAQPKNVIHQTRKLLFPEYNAKEYYAAVIKPVLLFLLGVIVATYIFFLIKAALH